MNALRRFTAIDKAVRRRPLAPVTIVLIERQLDTCERLSKLFSSPTSPRKSGNRTAAFASGHFAQCRTFVRGNVIGLVAFDFVLWHFERGVMGIAVVVEIAGVAPY